MKDALGIDLVVGDRVVVYDRTYINYRRSHGVFFATVTRFTPTKIGIQYTDKHSYNLLRQPHQVLKVI